MVDISNNLVDIWFFFWWSIFDKTPLAALNMTLQGGFAGVLLGCCRGYFRECCSGCCRGCVPGFAGCVVGGVEGVVAWGLGEFHREVIVKIMFPS